MKKLSFLAGMLTTALIGGLAVSALAATGQVTFNASALTLNGAQVSTKGENYILANGQSVPASITYTDEKGGGTTYLPVRRIGELMGVETGWDGAAGSVTVKGAVKAPATPEAPLPADYSDWTAEEEKAYQEFKGLWDFKVRYEGNDGISYNAIYTGTEKRGESFKPCAERLALEYASEHSYDSLRMTFFVSDDGVGYALVASGKITQSYFYDAV